MDKIELIDELNKEIKNLMEVLHLTFQLREELMKQINSNEVER